MSGMIVWTRLLAGVAASATMALVCFGGGGSASAQPAAQFVENDANLCHRFAYSRVTAPDGSGAMRNAAVAVEDRVPVWPRPEAVGQPSRTLAFSEPVIIRDQKGGGAWVEVRKPSDDALLGWVQGKDLLCHGKPLRDPHTGLERKAVIRTEGAAGAAQPVKAYPGSAVQGCPSSGCPELHRFDILYVFAERDGRLLLAKDIRFDTSRSRLIGWVDDEKVIRWNTAFGLRPREDLRDDKTVCAYRTIEDARAGKDCRPLAGGRSWFLSSSRLPILEEQGEFYKVAVNATGVDNVRRLDQNRIEIGDAVQQQNRIDVFFVVDGTESMTSLIEALKGVNGRPGIVEQITTKLKEKAALGATFRFGFRIYRDAVSPAHDDSLGEVFALSDTECVGNEQQHRDFHAAFSTVRARPILNPDKAAEDFAEDVYGGIYQSLTDMSGCPDNAKLMFVIGDHGYDPARRRQRGLLPIETKDLVDAIRNKIKTRENKPRQPGLFFVQMPKDPGIPHSAQSRQEYNRAYELFSSQADEILKQLYPAERQQDPGLPGKPFARLEPGPLSESRLTQISDRVNALSHPEIINRLEIDLRGGQALSEAIRQLRRNHADVPILFWSMIEQRMCERLDQQCHSQFVEGVGTLYVKKSSDVVTDVRLTSDHMTTWTQLLEGAQGASIVGNQLRRTFAVVLSSSLERAVETSMAQTQEEMGEFLRRVGGIPTRDRSPLMSYSIDNLFDTSGLQECEIEHIRRWVQSRHRILGIASIRNGVNEPIFQEGPADVPGCPLSDKGKRVPSVSGDISVRPLGGTDEYSYAKVVDNQLTFWIPQRFMP